MKVVWARTARIEYLDAIARIRLHDQRAAARVAARIGEAIDALSRRNTGRRGRVDGTFEKSVTGLPYVIAYAIEIDARLQDGRQLVVLRIVHTSRNWPSGRWPGP